MKLLVVVETLYGSPRTLSIERTLSAPEPIPRRPETAPATTISSHASGTRRGKYACSPPAREGKDPFRPRRVASGSGDWIPAAAACPFHENTVWRGGRRRRSRPTRGAEGAA